MCGDDTALSSGAGITVLRFDTTLSFDVVGYISGMAYDFIAKRVDIYMLIIGMV